jgi:hypothetical protein
MRRELAIMTFMPLCFSQMSMTQCDAWNVEPRLHGQVGGNASVCTIALFEDVGFEDHAVGGALEVKGADDDEAAGLDSALRG